MPLPKNLALVGVEVDTTAGVVVTAATTLAATLSISMVMLLGLLVLPGKLRREDLFTLRRTMIMDTIAIMLDAIPNVVLIIIAIILGAKMTLLELWGRRVGLGVGVDVDAVEDAAEDVAEDALEGALVGVTLVEAADVDVAADAMTTE